MRHPNSLINHKQGLEKQLLAITMDNHLICLLTLLNSSNLVTPYLTASTITTTGRNYLCVFFWLQNVLSRAPGSTAEADNFRSEGFQAILPTS